MTVSDDEREKEKERDRTVKPGEVVRPLPKTGATSKLDSSKKKDPPKEIKKRSGSASDNPGEPSDVLRIISSLESAFTNSLQQVMAESSRRSASDVTDATRTRDMQRKALLDVLRSNIRELNVKALDMSQEIVLFLSTLISWPWVKMTLPIVPRTPLALPCWKM